MSPTMGCSADLLGEWCFIRLVRSSVSVLPKYAFIRPDGATPDAKDILVQSLVPELMGRVVRTGSCQRPRL